MQKKKSFSCSFQYYTLHGISQYNWLLNDNTGEPLLFLNFLGI